MSAAMAKAEYEVTRRDDIVFAEHDGVRLLGDFYAPKGLDKLEPLLARIAQDGQLPAITRELLAVLGREYARLQIELKEIEAKLLACHRADAVGRRLADPLGWSDHCDDAGDEDA